MIQPLPAPPPPEHLSSDWLRNPHIRLFGDITDAMVNDFLVQLDKACGQMHDQCPRSQVVIEVSSSGGTADNAYRIWEEIRLARDYSGVDFIFLGKTFVYSAGVTIMGAFPRDRRYLTRHTTLLVHERRLTQTINLAGPLRASLQIINEVAADIENGMRVERENFEQIIAGSDVTMGEIVERSKTGWYITAQEALQRRLVEGII